MRSFIQVAIIAVALSLCLCQKGAAQLGGLKGFAEHAADVKEERRIQRERDAQQQNTLILAGAIVVAACVIGVAISKKGKPQASQTSDKTPTAE